MGTGVAMLASVFNPSIGGIQTLTRRLAQRLASGGTRVLVITRHHRGLPREEEQDGFTVLRVGDGDASRALATASYIAAGLGALWSRRQEFDVVHAHQLLSPLTLAL